MLTAILTLTLLAAAFGVVLGYASIRFKVEGDPLVDKIDKILPQTQCGQCGFPGCKPYATAIAAGAEINQCPPGGEDGMLKLAELLGRDPLPLNPENGVAKTVKTLALIDEAVCIGCTKCIQACPVDAIVGAANQMHTVIESHCTGCELCLPPCPVDCITMEPVADTVKTWRWPLPPGEREAA